MKTKTLSSEQNGISIAVDVGADKPVYATPSALRALLQNATAIAAELATWPDDVLTAIDERAGQTPEARKLARVTSQRTKLEAAVASATSDAARDVATLELKLFNLKNA